MVIDTSEVQFLSFILCRHGPWVRDLQRICFKSFFSWSCDVITCFLCSNGVCVSNPNIFPTTVPMQALASTAVVSRPWFYFFLFLFFPLSELWGAKNGAKDLGCRKLTFPSWSEHCFWVEQKKKKYKTGVINDPLDQPTDPAGSDCRLILKCWDGRTDRRMYVRTDGQSIWK